jgi:hypothetical protein
MSRKILLAALGIAIALPAFAGQGTKEVPISKAGTVDVNLTVDKINLRAVELDFGGKIGGPIQKSKGEVKAMIDNNSEMDMEVGIAVVLLDDKGNIVGATTGGTKVGTLKKGQRDTSTVGFGYVYRNIEHAKKMIVTLETLAPK